MRLWHFELVKNSLLPKGQLISQWRELNSIYKKQDNHILINYIYNYSKRFLYEYSLLVIEDMKKRGYKINKWDNFNSYLDKETIAEHTEFKHRNLLQSFSAHDDRYLLQNYYNLQEKYDRRQKDFSDELYHNLEKFMKEKGLI